MSEVSELDSSERFADFVTDLVALTFQIRLGSSVTFDIWIKWRAVYQKALHFLLVGEYLRVAESLARPAASGTPGEIPAPN